MTIKTPEQIADEAIAADASEHLNMEIANAEDVHAIVTRAIEADRAQRPRFFDLDELLSEWEEFDGDVSYFYDKWHGIINDRADWTAGRIRTLTAEWEGATGDTASDYAYLSRDDWAFGLAEDEADEIARLIEWQEARA